MGIQVTRGVVIVYMLTGVIFYIVNSIIKFFFSFFLTFLSAFEVFVWFADYSYYRQLTDEKTSVSI